MLEGEIVVGHLTVAEYTATRAENANLEGVEAYWYDCTLKTRDSDGYNSLAEFSVLHMPAHGAIMLTQNLLRLGHSKLRKVYTHAE